LTKLRVLVDPIEMWSKYANDLGLDDALRTDIAEELASAVRWQTHSYQHPPRAPTLADPSIVWEQSIVEGHPTHPVSAGNISLCGTRSS
jgi:siderophore synthetase component